MAYGEAYPGDTERMLKEYWMCSWTFERYSDSRFRVVMEHYEKGKYGNMRLGQILYNEFVDGAPWPELFYEQDNKKAMKMFFNALAEWQEVALIEQEMK